MKKRGMLALLILVTCLMHGCLDSTLSPSPQPAADGTEDVGIIWYSYEEGMKIAGEQNKPVMIDVYTGWCRWCKELDRVVYTDSEVVNLADQFVCIKINADKRRDIAARYNPSGGVPVIVFLRSDGTEAHRIGGYPRGGSEAVVHEMMVALNNA